MLVPLIKDNAAVEVPSVEERFSGVVRYGVGLAEWELGVMHFMDHVSVEGSRVISPLRFSRLLIYKWGQTQ